MCHPHYSHKNAICKYRLQKVVYAFCCGMAEEENPNFNEASIIPEYLPVWQAFKKNDFDFYKFMVEKNYELIEDEELRVEVLMWACFPVLNLPIARFMIDWSNGYLDFFKRETGDISDTEVLLKLFFCTTEQDVWRYVATGTDIESLYHWYKGDELYPILRKVTGVPCYSEKDEKKAKEFLEYLLSDTTVATDSVRKQAMELKKIAEENPFDKCR